MGSIREEFILPEGGLLSGSGGGDRNVFVDEDPAGLDAIAAAMEEPGILEEEDMTEEYFGGETRADIGGEFIW